MKKSKLFNFLNIVTYFGLGIYLSSIGYDLFTKEYWIILVLVVTIDFTSFISKLFEDNGM